MIQSPSFISVKLIPHLYESTSWLKIIVKRKIDEMHVSVRKYVERRTLSPKLNVLKFVSTPTCVCYSTLLSATIHKNVANPRKFRFRKISPSRLLTLHRERKFSAKEPPMSVGSLFVSANSVPRASLSHFLVPSLLLSRRFHTLSSDKYRIRCSPLPRNPRPPVLT